VSADDYSTTTLPSASTVASTVGTCSAATEDEELLSVVPSSVGGVTEAEHALRRKSESPMRAKERFIEIRGK